LWTPGSTIGERPCIRIHVVDAANRFKGSEPLIALIFADVGCDRV
jgi:hypothetical protein